MKHIVTSVAYGRSAKRRVSVLTNPLALCAVTLMTLASCDPLGPEDPVAGQTQRLGAVAQVTSVTGIAPGQTDGSVSYFAIDASFQGVPIADADVELDGTFVLDLSGVVPASHALRPLTDWADGDLTELAFLQISNPDVKLTYHRGFVVKDAAGEEIGSLLLFDGPTLPPGVQVNWLYADGDAEIVGAGSHFDAVFTFDLILKQGWNQYVQTTQAGGSNLVFYTGEVPEEVDWYIDLD